MVYVEAENIDNRPLELFRPLSLDIIKQALIEEFKIENVEVDIESDSFKVGRGASALLSSSSPCLVIYNKKYRKKYYSLVLEVRQQYGRTFAYLHMGGTSKNLININMSQFVNESGERVYRTGFVGDMLGNRAKKGMIDENMYYSIASKIVSMALSKATDNPESYSNNVRKNQSSSQTYRKKSNTPPSQTQKNNHQAEQYQTKSQFASTEKKAKEIDGKPNIASETKEKIPSGLMVIMWLVWITFSLLGMVAFGPEEAIPMGLFGIVLLYCGQKLIQKAHPVWAVLPIFLGA